MSELHHLTLNTGAYASKRREDLAPHILTHLKKLLAGLLPYTSNRGFCNVNVPAFEKYQIHVFSRSPETAFFYITHGRTAYPFCYFAVALEDGEYANVLWRDLCVIACIELEKQKNWLATFTEDKPELDEEAWFAKLVTLIEGDKSALPLPVMEISDTSPIQWSWCAMLAENLRTSVFLRDLNHSRPQAPWLASYSCPNDVPWLVGDFDCYMGFAFMALRRRNRFRQAIIQINQRLESIGKVGRENLLQRERFESL